MLVRHVGVCMFFALIMTSLVDGHARLEWPTPRTTNAGIKSGPCGTTADELSWTLNPTTIAPGKLTVSFVETINHSGAPFRLALSFLTDDNFADQVLLDHIPHNAAGSTPRQYLVTVDIPDVDCRSPTRCALQLVQVMTDKLAGNPGSNTCSTLGGDCFSVYYSCANVFITGNTAPASLSYTYTGPTGPWGTESATYDADGFKAGDSTVIWQNPLNGSVSYPPPPPPPTPGPGPGPSPSPGTDDGLRGTDIAFIVLGVIAAVLLLVGGVVMVMRHRSRSAYEAGRHKSGAAMQSLAQY